MRKFKSITYRILLLPLAVCLIFLLYYMQSRLAEADRIADAFKGIMTPLFYIFGTISLFIVVRFLSRLRKSFSIPASFAILILGQLIILLTLKPQLRYDMNKVFLEALKLLDQGIMEESDFGSYFAHYANNRPFCLFVLSLLSLAKTINIPRDFYVLFLQIVNMIFIDTGILFGYFALKKTRGNTAAFILLILCVLNPIMYFLPVYFYTSTISLPLTTGLILLFIIFLRQKKPVLYIACTIAMGVIFWCAYEVRATSAIIPIAMLLFCFFNYKFNLKKLGTTLFVFLACFLVLTFLYKPLEKKYMGFDPQETTYSVTHWLMLGLSENGIYNSEDDNLSASIPTYHERQQMNLEKIQERASSLGLEGYIKLFQKKLKYTWGHGLYEYYDNLGTDANFSRFTDFLIGSRKDLLVSYMHLFHFFMIVFVIVGLVRLGTARSLPYTYLFYLTLTGAFIFHLFWEAGEVYSIPFILLLLICAADGITAWSIPDKFISVAHMPCIAYSVAAFIMLFHPLTGIPFENVECVVLQDMDEDENHIQENGQDNVLEQTFYADRPFNTLSLYTIHTQEAAACSYLIQLSDSSGNLILSDSLSGSKADYGNYFTFSTVDPEKGNDYSVRITPQNVTQKDYLTFLIFDTGHWDIYKKGVLSLNGTDTTGDLRFSISHNIEKPFLKLPEFFAFAILFILLQILVQVKLLK